MNLEDESGDENDNYEIFRDCVSTALIKRLATPKRPERRRAGKGRKNAIKPVARAADEKEVDDAEDLAEFIDYLATEIFTSLPPDLRTLSYSSTQSHPSLLDHYSTLSTLDSLSTTLPPTITDSLTSYTLLARSSDLSTFLTPLLTSYLESSSTPPPALTAPSRPAACELCARPHIPLTTHHLIPRSHAAKAVRRGWCRPEEPVTRLAYLCRACHSFVHGLAGNEELARSGWARSVEGIRAEKGEEVERWVGWVGRVRWAKR